MRLNLNDNIKVKLTEHGKDIYYHQYDMTNAFLAENFVSRVTRKLTRTDIQRFSFGAL